MTFTKTLCLSALAVTVSGLAFTSAQADDLSGTRLAVHADYLWGKIEPEGFANAADAKLKSYETNDGGAGFELRHDWQNGDTVFGLFGTASWVDAKGGVSGTKTTTDNEGATVTTHHGFDTDLSLLAAVGGRVGHVVNDNTLLYIQGGIATGRVEITETGDGATATGDVSKTGYMAGVGIDVQLNERWSLGFSYNHYDLGEVNFAPAAYDAGRLDVTGNMAAISLGYRF